MLCWGPAQELLGRADKEMALGTRLFVEGYGCGVYMGCTATRIGSNRHMVAFGGAVPLGLRLKDLVWHVTTCNHVQDV